MKLIDINKIHLDDGWNEEHKKFTSYSSAMIDEAEIVDAIPIEWIEDWQNRHEWEYQSYFTMRDGIPKYAITCMLEDWKKNAES